LQQDRKKKLLIQDKI